MTDVLERYDKWMRGLCEPPSLDEMADELRRILVALEDLENQAIRDVVPNWVSVPTCEWDAAMRAYASDIDTGRARLHAGDHDDR